MEKRTMSIHRGLAELKTLDSRIQKAISLLDVVGVKKAKGLVNESIEEDEFIASAKADFQSATDLIARKTAIKTAIVLSNATTMIDIEGVGEMSVADAITYKETTCEYKKSMLTTLITRGNKAAQKLKNHNFDVEERALDMAKTALGKDNVKLGDDDVTKVTDTYIKANSYTYVDPLGLTEVCETLKKEILAFEIEIDAVLSESNAITTITL